MPKDFRIMMASSGYYYVQRFDRWNGWRKLGKFFQTRAGARRFALDMKHHWHPPVGSSVLEYV